VRLRCRRPDHLGDDVREGLDRGATDGQHLYWMDYDRKRIMRAGRSAKTSP